MAASGPARGHVAAFAFGGAAAVAAVGLLGCLRRQADTTVPSSKEAPPSPEARRGSSASPGHEPDEEPDAEHHEHHEHHAEFVRVLRIARESEPKRPNWWKISDIQETSEMYFAIQELNKYFAEWREVGHDPFWQRKSKKIVIAVVVCRQKDGSFVAYRGMNTEVSLPSGSLCAERAGIARAASEWRSAQEIVCVAVLDPDHTINPLWPCEVCQSWLAKLREKNDAIAVLAFKDPTCEEFVVRVNGVLQPHPRVVTLPPEQLRSRIRLAEGVEEQPWEADHLAYVDGSFSSLDAEHYSLLRAAFAAGTHVLVGLHSDATLEAKLGKKPSEAFETRLGRVLEDRHVHSVLLDAPWCVTEDLVEDLKISTVLTGAVGGVSRCKDVSCQEVYQEAQQRGILQIVPLTG